MSANVTDEKLVLFAGVPHQHDAHQDFLRGALSDIEIEDGRPLQKKILLRGFRASCVDLGWLHDRCEQWWDTNTGDTIDDGDIRGFCELINRELPEVVQRLKEWTMRDDGGHLVVRLQTKDDRSWYEYEFSVLLYENTDDGEREDVPEEDEKAA